MKLGIAFEGCASRAAFLVGVVERMLELGITPHAVSGASSGSIIAATLAAGRASELREMWLEVAGTPVFQPRRALRGTWPMRMSEIVGGAVRRHLGTLQLPDLDLPIAIPVTLLTLRGPRRHILTHRDPLPLPSAILASCFFPGPYSQPIFIQKRLALDGAWAVRTPVEEVYDLGATHVIAVVTHPEGRLETGFFRPGLAPPPKGCAILAPLEPVPIKSWELNTERSLRSMDLGYRSAHAFFENHPEFIA